MKEQYDKHISFSPCTPLIIITQQHPAFLSQAGKLALWCRKRRWPHTEVRRDASAFYSLRQHLLCVIAPSPTRFTPYILSSSHLPHLYLPLCRPLPPSLSIFLSLSLSLPPFSLSSRLLSSQSSSLLASIPPSDAAAGLRCTWADITPGLSR